MMNVDSYLSNKLRQNSREYSIIVALNRECLDELVWGLGKPDHEISSHRGVIKFYYAERLALFYDPRPQNDKKHLSVC